MPLKKNSRLESPLVEKRKKKVPSNVERITRGSFHCEIKVERITVRALAAGENPRESGSES